MARPLRIEYEGALYHVTARGNERKRIYFTKTDYGKFKEYLEGAQEKYGCLLHAYVFMTNHYHMIIETPKPNISKVMHFINGAYTTYINKKRDSKGMGVRPTQLTIKQPAFQKFRPDYDLFQNLQNLREC